MKPNPTITGTIQLIDLEALEELRLKLDTLSDDNAKTLKALINDLIAIRTVKQPYPEFLETDDPEIVLSIKQGMVYALAKETQEFIQWDEKGI